MPHLAVIGATNFLKVMKMCVTRRTRDKRSEKKKRAADHTDVITFECDPAV